MPVLPEYEVDWRAHDQSKLKSIITIQAFNKDSQITIQDKNIVRYLHIQGSRGGYHLLLASTVIAITSIKQKGITNVDFTIETNLSIKPLKRALSNKGDNHRTATSEYFEMKDLLCHNCKIILS